MSNQTPLASKRTRWTRAACLTAAGLVLSGVSGRTGWGRVVAQSVVETHGERLASGPVAVETTAGIMARPAAAARVAPASPARESPRRIRFAHDVFRAIQPGPAVHAYGPAPAAAEPPGVAAAFGEIAPVTAGLSFAAATLADTAALPPDAAGAAGATQFLLAANGRIRSFNKTTGAADGVLNTTPDVFFASVRGAAGTFSPSVKYDRLTGRWFLTVATDDSPGQILIASSNQATIAASTVWSFFAVANTFPAAACTVDSPTLGLDASALYIGVSEFCGASATFTGSSAFVVRKASAIDGGPLVATAFHNLTGTPGGAGLYAPQGVDNADPSPAFGYFVGVDNAAFGRLIVRRVSNPGGTPSLSPDLPVAVPATAAPIRVRHQGNLGGSDGLLDGGDDRIASAKVRNGRLWAVHAIGVNESGAAAASPTRNGLRWYELQSLDATPALAQSGTLHSTTPGVDDRQHWVPSLATSGQGRTVIGFNTAGTSEFVNAGAAERLAADAAGTLRATTLLTSSAAAYNPAADPGSAARGRRWGGYSETAVDPCDDQTIWTIHPYADAIDSYALQVTRTLAPPPATVVTVAPVSIALNTASVDLSITASSTGGAAFFDPGAPFACRPSAVIPGVTINSVTITGPASAIVNVSTVNATPGFKPITITNPDGQASTSASLLTVLPGPLMRLESPAGGAAGQPLTVQGWAIDGAAASGTGVDVVQVYAHPATGAPQIFLGTAAYGAARPDVAALYGPQFAVSGFSLVAPVLPAGGYTIVAHARSSATATFNNSQSVAVTLGAPAPPFGSLDTPADGVTVAGELAVTGWALDDAGVSAVTIYRDPVAGEGSAQLFIGQGVFVRGARTDVQSLYPAFPNSDTAGWGYMLLTNMLPNQGNGTFRIYAYAVDQAGLTTLLGSRRIVAANAASSLPFGTIDTPAQGATVSGTIVNFGWALTGSPRRVPIDGSTIDVYIDGVLVGHPVYNQFRSDIATLFPGLQNSNGAVGFFMLDTTRLSNGLHTIAWVIRDDAGGASGVGSRFFRVAN